VVIFYSCGASVALLFRGMRDLLLSAASGRFASIKSRQRSGDLLLLQRLYRFAFSRHA
jgi:hypothetical protein